MSAAITVHAVLAGAYTGFGRQGTTSGADKMLTHAMREGDGKTLCGRIKEDRICDVVEPGPPTCKVCALRVARLEAT